MNTLEDQIDTFIDPDFNAEASARHFFATNTENELSRKLNELAAVQSSVETVLKQKVRQNYKIFLHANDEISRVGKDMVDLNQLIGHTQGLIQSISMSRESERAKSMAHRRNRTSTVKRRLVEVPFQSLSVKYGDVSLTAREVSDIPAVILNAPNDLIRLIIEQMYPQAVLLIKQLQEYFIGVTGDGDNEIDVALGSPLTVIMRKVKEISTQLAFQLKRSLVELPNSSLWGAEERRKRLKLLVELGRADMAAEGFVLSQVDVIRRVMSRVLDAHSSSSSGPESQSQSQSLEALANLSCTKELCAAFFSALADSSSSYLELFAEQSEDSNIVSLLLMWSQKQVAAFVTILAKQIQRGAYEQSSKAVAQLRACTFGVGAERTPNTAINIALPIVLTVKPVTYGPGPLSFASTCLDIAFAEALQLDALGLHGRATLTWLLLADVQRVGSAFTEDLLREVSLEVRQDSWAAFLLPSGTVRTPQQTEDAEGGEDEAVLVSGSYSWMLGALHLYLKEVWALIKGDSTQGPRTHSQAPSSASGEEKELEQEKGSKAAPYSRSDLCEAEPSMVACVLRLLVRYVTELEAVSQEGERSALSNAQLQCYAATLKAVSSKLLPSAALALEGCLYSEGLAHQPKATVSILITRVQQLSSLEKHRLSADMMLLVEEETQRARYQKQSDRERERVQAKKDKLKLLQKQNDTGGGGGGGSFTEAQCERRQSATSTAREGDREKERREKEVEEAKEAKQKQNEKEKREREVEEAKQKQKEKEKKAREMEKEIQQEKDRQKQENEEERERNNEKERSLGRERGKEREKERLEVKEMGAAAGRARSPPVSSEGVRVRKLVGIERFDAKISVTFNSSSFIASSSDSSESDRQVAFGTLTPDQVAAMNVDLEPEPEKKPSANTTSTSSGDSSVPLRTPSTMANPFKKEKTSAPATPSRPGRDVLSAPTATSLAASSSPFASPRGSYEALNRAAGPTVSPSFTPSPRTPNKTGTSTAADRGAGGGTSTGRMNPFLKPSASVPSEGGALGSGEGGVRKVKANKPIVRSSSSRDDDDEDIVEF